MDNWIFLTILMLAIAGVFFRPKNFLGVRNAYVATALNWWLLWIPALVLLGSRGGIDQILWYCFSALIILYMLVIVVLGIIKPEQDSLHHVIVSFFRKGKNGKN